MLEIVTESLVDLRTTVVVLWVHRDQRPNAISVWSRHDDGDAVNHDFFATSHFVVDRCPSNSRVVRNHRDRAESPMQITFGKSQSRVMSELQMVAARMGNVLFHVSQRGEESATPGRRVSAFFRGPTMITY